jgi:molybdopterin synthase catalytic subunit
VVADSNYIRAAVAETGLEPSEAEAFVSDPRAGAVVLFLGVTRSVTDGRETVRLSYEAYIDMAEESLREIAQEALSKFDACKLYVRHRVGVVPAGEASVLIAVSSPHRGDAFSACRYVIDEIKRRSPIWKKEHFRDGDAEWVEGSDPRAIF